MWRTAALIIIALATPSARSFEIKPICPVTQKSLQGAYCAKANTDEIEPRSGNSDCEDEKAYALLGRNQPIHEAITRRAHTALTGKHLTYNYLTPLLSGVEWNDDPEQDLRKHHLANGITHILAFVEKIQTKLPPSSTAIRSHYGDLQFLHSMRPSGLEDAPPDQIRSLIYDWMQSVYGVAIGKIGYNTPIADTPFARYFRASGGYNVIADIFDKRRFLVSDRYASTMRGLAAGSMLHVIQDSYSRSHTHRDSGTGELVDFFSYPNHSPKHHCHGDAGYEANMPAIDAAFQASRDFLALWRKKASWCGEVEPLVRKIFSITDSAVAPQC